MCERVCSFRNQVRYLKETGQVWDDGNEEKESFVHTLGFASGLPEFVISPAIVADIEFHTSQGLDLND